MFYSISWQGYWTTLALLAAVYYLIICFLYYRDDFRQWLQRLQSKSIKVNPSTSVPFLPGQEQEHTGEFPQPSLFDASEESILAPVNKDASIVKDFTGELTAFLEAVKQQRLVKQEVLYGLKRLLEKYPVLKEAADREVLAGLLAGQCKQICSMALSAEDMAVVGMGKGT